MRLIAKRLEFQGVSGRIADKHCRLLARKAHIRLDNKFGSGAFKPVGQGLPLIPSEDQSEMAHRHGMTIDGSLLRLGTLIRRLMRDDLMAMEVKINPKLAGAPFWTAQELPIISARLGQVINRKSQVKTRMRRRNDRR